MMIHLCLILFLISSSLFTSSDAEGENRQIEETEEKRVSVEVETLNVQLQILTLLKKMEEQNSEVIKEISNGLKENTNEIKEITKQVRENTKEISNGLKEITTEIKEITKKVKEDNKIIKDFISEIKDNTNGIKGNTDEIKKITIDIKDISKGIEKNNDKEKEVITEIKEITNDIKHEIIIDRKIKDYFIPARNCDDLRQKGNEKSGIRTVNPYPYSPGKSIEVLCDQQTEGGGWTVFQVRENLPKRENFQRNWKNYSQGFGNLTGEFWMGLELINVMTKLDVMELRVDLEDDTGEKRFAKYESFSVDDEDEKFKLNIGSYGGTAGNSLVHHNKQMFSTMDEVNNGGSRNCAVNYKGAWWYGSSCHSSNLNGFPHVGNHSSFADGINWVTFRGFHNSMVKTKMMFRLSGRVV